jgi:hypothetical protein
MVSEYDKIALKFVLTFKFITNIDIVVIKDEDDDEKPSLSTGNFIQTNL